ncbi:MAG: TolC family protein [Terracidiphilus sp.]
MKLRPDPACRQVILAIACLGFAGFGAGKSPARAQNPTSATNPYWGSVTAQPVTDAPLKLSLDDAVRRGLNNNLGLKEAESGEKALHGEKNEVEQVFLPTITASADTGYYMHNLAALGFGPKTISEFSKLFPGGKTPAGFSDITRDTLTDGKLQLTQVLFSAPAIAAYKAAGAAERSSYFAKMTARGEVVQRVAGAYLRAVADASEVENAQAQLKQSQVLEQHAHDAHVAGVAANLDELRAQVEVQSQQQALLAAQNQQAKDLILLKREIGVDPAQQLTLSDQAPYSELAAQTPEELRALAYKSRQDYQNLQNQVVVYKALHSSARAERLPSLTFYSYYQVSAVTTVGAHGNFIAMGNLSFPIFREAGVRGDEQASQANQSAITAQLDEMRSHIDEQVRAALLDVNANSKLVDVARSNVDLATRALSDETDRVTAGVDDNLPLVTAQATLASAQTNLVEGLYQYNISKLALARAAGVLEQQYRVYLGE